jgi:cellobiose-specific phosphotransferase system component IIA
VIEFALTVLGIELYPWQKWLLIHALELNPDGTYRFRKVFVIVGRQNGKTTLLTVLTLFWLFMDADRHPEHLPAHEFLILGTAQNLDLAEEAWDSALKRCDPFPEEDDEMFVVPDLAAEARKPVKKNGSKALRLKNNARYEPRAASRMGGRGKSAARVVMDEMREQQTWDVWGSVSKTKNAIYDSQLWGISSAGDAKSIVLQALRAGLIKSIEAWDTYVESGLQSIEEFANGHDIASALFEWSAPDGADLLDQEAIEQSNPSVGHRPMFYDSIRSDLLGDESEAVKRTEILCQWVTSLVKPYIDGAQWAELADPPMLDDRGKLVDPGSQIAAGSKMCLALDTTWDRSRTYLAVAGYREDGLAHVEVIARRAGMLWAVPKVIEIAKRQGIAHVAVQTRGCPSADFVKPLIEAGFEIVKVEATDLLNSAGRFSDRVRDGQVRHRAQKPLDLAIAGGITKALSGMPVWDREKSAVDVSPAVAATNALFGLEVMPEPETYRSAYEDNEPMII